MEARNRALPEWFNRIKTGQLRLPRFQRHEAWSHNEVSGLLATVLRGLPSGATLILEVGGAEPFISRSIVGAPAPTERVTEHLLDGQQRLTALWRSLNDNFEDRTYFVYFEVDEDHDGRQIATVDGISRYIKNGEKYPAWAEKPPAVNKRGYLPLKLLRPGDIASEIDDWISQAVGDEDAKAIVQLNKSIQSLREKVSAFNLPFLSLPTSTPKDVALDVFIKMNTSSVKLSPFDIVVAQVEEATDSSLHELVANAKAKAPAVDAYADLPELILAIAALREDRAPTQASYQRLDLRRMVDEWDAIVEGLAFMTDLLEEQRVYDEQRLPTYVVLPVLAALHAIVPKTLDAHGNARTLLRRYLWSAFVTRRYESAASGKALQDFRGLRDILLGGRQDRSVPMFDPSTNPLPTVDELKRAGWPKSRETLARGILAVAQRRGALDIADGIPVSRGHLHKREYHHLFPDALLTQDGGVESSQIYLALNCALITWNTNRTISAKEPLRYLRERADQATLGEAEIKTRLASHLVPYDQLNVGNYSILKEGGERQNRLRSDYEEFLNTRAELVLGDIRKLCAGEI